MDFWTRLWNLISCVLVKALIIGGTMVTALLQLLLHGTKMFLFVIFCHIQLFSLKILWTISVYGTDAWIWTNNSIKNLYILCIIWFFIKLQIHNILQKLLKRWRTEAFIAGGTMVITSLQLLLHETKLLLFWVF